MPTVDSSRFARGASLLGAVTVVVLAQAAPQTPADAEPPSIAVSVQQPRPFGYVLGDRLEQRLSLQAPPGFALDPKSLPRTGRAGLWLELAPPRLTSDRQGRILQYRLTLEYQIINVPGEVRTIDLPPVDLVFTGRGRQVSTVVDEWPITIAPITPTYVLARAGLPEIRPDARPSLSRTSSYRRLTLLWAAALVVLIAVLALRRRGMEWLGGGARPFARAARDIAKLARLPPARATYRRGLQRLHRAFDAAAGQAMFGDRLTDLFASHPELLGRRAEIEQFYADSQREFFGTQTGSASLSEVLALARRCRDAEAVAPRGASGGRAGSDRSPHAL